MNLSFTLFLVSQGLFAKAYGGTGLEYARKVIKTSDGGFMIAGTTQGFGAGSDDWMVIKTDHMGNFSWARTIGGTGSDECFSVVQTPDEGYVIGGVTYSYGSGVADALLVKLNSSGGLVWTRVVGSTGEDRIHALVNTSDGGIAAAGRTINYGAGSADFLLMKFDASGNLLWSRTFGGSSTDDAYAITETSDGGLVVAGLTYSFGGGNCDVLVVKWSSTGAFQWARTFGGASTDDAFGVIETSDGGLALACYAMSFGAGNGDIYVLKLASDGTLQWNRAIGGTSDDWGFGIVETSDLGLVISGRREGTNRDLHIIKLSSSGTLLWARTFGASGDDDVLAMVSASDGGFVSGGYTSSYGAGNRDFLLLKIAPDGSYPGCITTWSPSVVTPTPTQTTPSGAGTCNPPNSSPNPTVTTPAITTTDACPPVGSDEWAEEGLGLTVSLLPGGILFNSPETMAIKIYNPDGRVVYSGELREGENRVPLEAGVYFWITRKQTGKVAIR
ncbi:MAG: hypothetical protein ABIM46_07970 [candidate division WOR-3 bacterium]